MKVLYMCVREQNGKPLYVGYINVNKAAVKIMTAQSTDDIHAYMEMRGFTEVKWREPAYPTYQMIRSKW